MASVSLASPRRCPEVPYRRHGLSLDDKDSVHKLSCAGHNRSRGRREPCSVTGDTCATGAAPAKELGSIVSNGKAEGVQGELDDTLCIRMVMLRVVVLLAVTGSS